jgi:phage tail sheath protein FI
MPEYLAPGVYVEETSFRSKSIEGVPTSTTGYAGMTRYGPVQYLDGPKTTEPRLITSFTEFERVYGGLDSLFVGDDESATEERLCYLAHAARAYFENGGKRLYISRVYASRGEEPNLDIGVASSPDVTVGDITGAWRARWPGSYGNVLVETKVVRSKNLVFTHPIHELQATRVKPGGVVEILAAGSIVSGNAKIDITKLAVVTLNADGKQKFIRHGETKETASDLKQGEIVQLVEMQVTVTEGVERIDVYDELAADIQQKRFIGEILQKDDPEDENSIVWFDYDPTDSASPDFLPAELIAALRGDTEDSVPIRLSGGHDGKEASPEELRGKAANPDVAAEKATGLEALGEIDDIAIVALPDGGTYEDPDICAQAADQLISHAERLRYRIAVVDAPRGRSMTEIRSFRGRFDSKYAALYHPWIEIFDPNARPAQGAPPPRLMLPSSGFVTGIYARSDIERGVHKAPANEVVRGLTRFEANINKERQDVLNPEGINALRFFEGRGNRVWGARTMSSDPEWKYVNVRRLFIYIEHSIDKGTQWTVFEPNGPKLWANLRQTVEDFLLVLWRDGALLGDKPEQAYFVRCDRTTMTQNDLDNGRLICLIGIAPVKPAEFVIFRIGQWTADAKI